MSSRPKRSSSSFFFVGVSALVVLTLLGCLAVAHLDQILVEYHAAQAIDPMTEKPGHREWLLAHPALAAPVLVDKLKFTQTVFCERTGKLLEEMLQAHHDPTDPEDALWSLNLASQLQRHYAEFSQAGKIQAIHLAMGVLELHLNRWSPNVATALATAGQVIRAGLWDPSSTIQAAAADSLAGVWLWSGSDNIARALVEEWMYLCNKREVELLSSDSALVRAAAARALNGAIDHSGDLRLVKLLDDEDSIVRRAALETLASSAVDSIGAGERRRLLELLDDPDPEIQVLARRVLVESGLPEERVRLAALQRHKSPEERAKVASEIFNVSGIDRAMFLNELAKDPSPIVRRAAIEAASRVDHPMMRDLIKQLSVDDPDGDVRKTCQMILQNPTADRRP